LFDNINGDDGNDLKFLGLGSKQTLKRAGIGFRFVGDFWDRYWTCHILEYEPKDDSALLEKGFRPYSALEDTTIHKTSWKLQFEELITPEQHKSKLSRGLRPWRQRKVLELLLFDKMLRKIALRYADMFYEIIVRLRKEAEKHQEEVPPLKDLVFDLRTFDSGHPVLLLVSNSLFSSGMTNAAYSSFNQEWPQIQYTLQVMEADLQETLDLVEAWRSREKNRQQDKPRWTKRDETKYRSVIDQTRASNMRRIRQLERHLAEIRSLKTSLANMLQSARDDLSYQSAENVRRFTYVTVVFLPLGFATAIFSMNGKPSGDTLKSMIITVFITLTVTTIVLMSVQFLSRSDKIGKITKSLIKSPIKSLISTYSKIKIRPIFQKRGNEDTESGKIDISSTLNTK
jgi:Mg2+ and Co2+ transporter CorA